VQKQRLLSIAVAALAFAACESSILAPTPGVARPNGESPIPTDPVTPPTDPTPPPPPPEFAPAPVTARVILPWQYVNAVRDLLGPTAAALVTPPPPMVLNGFASIGAAQLSITNAAVTAYEDSAFKAAAAGLAYDPTIIPCAPTGPADQSCYTKLVQTFGRRAFRRTVTADEVTRWVAVGVEAGNAYSNFTDGARHIIAGMLQSPNFLYLPETGAPDPSHPGWKKLTGLEMASRLSFLLNGTLPDGQLLAAAEAGELDTADGVRNQALRLIARPEAIEATQHFFSELLDLEKVKLLSKDQTSFPGFNAQVAASMAEETRQLIQDIVFNQAGDVRGLFDAPYTFVDARLNAYYGLGATVPSDGSFVKVQLPQTSLRGGLLGQGAFLSLNAHPASTSPTHRGKFVRERFLCQTVGAPPNNVNTSFPEDPPGQPRTMKEKLMAHRQNTACAGCHAMMDDIGLGLENFDATGRYREQDVGKPIDANSNLDGKPFAGARELGTLVRSSPSATMCLVKSLFRFSAGHVDQPTEIRPMLAAHDAFAAAGYRFDTAIIEIVASDAFRYAGEVTP
jgi:hypothetical protein